MQVFYLNSPLLNKKMLTDRGNWREYQKKDNKIDLLIIERSLTIKGLNLSYTKDLGIENFIKIEGIDKYNLLEKFKKTKYVQKQIALDPDKISKKVLNFIKPNKVYLVKPVDSFKGKGIFSIRSKEELIDKYDKLKKTHSREQEILKKKNKIHWLLQEYITDPMLYNGKKFHIRTYYIITSDGRQFLSKISHVRVAEKKFILEDFDNRDIHDTHYNQKIGDIIFSDESHKGFTDEAYNKIKKNLIKLHKKFISKLNLIVYDNVELAFQIIGADTMITKNCDCIFLEMGTPPLISGIAKYLYEGIFQEIVDKVYPPLKKVKRNNNLYKLN
jgi:hypothetical protein